MAAPDPKQELIALIADTFTVESLREIQARPEYATRPDWQKQVRDGFTKLFGDVV